MNHKNVQSYCNRLGIGRLAFGASAVLITSLTVVQMPLTAGKPPVEPKLNPKFDKGSIYQKFTTPDAWVAKFQDDKVSDTARLVWSKKLGSSGYDVSNSVATDSSGNVFISGNTTGSLAGSNKGSDDAWVAKYSPDGALLWKKQLGTSEPDRSYGVATDSSGNVFISGYTYGSLAGSNKGGGDALVAKYSPDGALLWTKQLGTSENDYSYGVVTDSSGNVFMSGITYGSLAGSNKGGTDAWVAKYSSDGALLWTKQPGTSRNDSSNDVATDSSGNVFISGYTYGNALKH